MRGLTRGLFLLVTVLALGCAYPRRTTSLSPARANARVQGPDGVYRIRLSDAVIPPRKRTGQPWDSDNGAPDVQVRIYRDDELIFESSVVDNSLQPVWENEISENLDLSGNPPLRFELWDSDGVTAEPIGVWENNGMPRGALLDAETRIRVDGNAEIHLVLVAPSASVGTGIREYEVRSDKLLITELLPHSPAGRAGLVEGDAVIAIDGQSVESLGAARAASLLSMASHERSTLRVLRASGTEEDVTLDNQYAFHTR